MPAIDYTALKQALADHIPADRLITDPLRTLAYGTDASFYRLVPQIVAKVESEAEIKALLAACRKVGAPVTFRAAGTSLSGQSITDSVLVILGDQWTKATVERQGAAIRLQPGVIGADANRKLAAFARKIGPDPASIDSAKIGGIAANNSSGMCCGTSENSYQTLMSMRLILADGTLVDTGDAASVAAFRVSHAALLDGLAELGRQARSHPTLAERIRRKFAIKNTTGYSLNALVDFEDPIDILQHLMIGSEGTLGFIAEVVYRTVAEHAHKASALMLFADVAAACRAVQTLKGCPVAAVELMDRASLRSVEDKPGMPAEIIGLPDQATALLVETRAENADALAANIAAVEAAMTAHPQLFPARFTADPAEFGKLWKVRKGMLPAVGAVRPIGTAVITEDVAFRIEDLAQAALDLQALFVKHGYTEAILFGHALDGNLHFVFTQDFDSAAEIDRYSAFMDDICELVATKYEGSLKAEHGTGRNMAPFVELEWGREAYGLMWDIKRLLDPQLLLNPGVILNQDPKAHIDHLKPMPAAHAMVDNCMECGFCERMCPSHGLTLSPRQRIVGWREISRREAEGDAAPALRALYDYQGLDTCAACGLCATACPVGIETGLLTKAVRAAKLTEGQIAKGRFTARHFGAVMTAARLGLGVVRLSANIIGTDATIGLSRAFRKLSGNRLPRLTAGLPTPAPAIRQHTVSTGSSGQKVVYMPSCANRAMGPGLDDQDSRHLPDVLQSLMVKAGFAPILPQRMDGLCCGQSFESKGMNDLAAEKTAEMEAALRIASDNGKHPIVMDASACTLRLKRELAGKLTILDSVEFLHDQVMPRLDIVKDKAPVLLHHNCSSRRMGQDDKLIAIAKACADTVIIPDGVGCCGFAGDKGFTTPELNDHALRHLSKSVPQGCAGGYSSNRTCEIGLSGHSGVPYRSIAYLLDKTSSRKG